MVRPRADRLAAAEALMVDATRIADAVMLAQIGAFVLPALLPVYIARGDLVVLRWLSTPAPRAVTTAAG